MSPCWQLRGRRWLPWLLSKEQNCVLGPMPPPNCVGLEFNMKSPRDRIVEAVAAQLPSLHTTVMCCEYETEIRHGNALQQPALSHTTGMWAWLAPARPAATERRASVQASDTAQRVLHSPPMQEACNSLRELWSQPSWAAAQLVRDWTPFTATFNRATPSFPSP